MPSEAAMKAAMQAYFDHFNAGDVEAVVALFAPDATVEDPVGSPVHTGAAAIRAAFATVLASRPHLILSAPPRGSHGNAAAMALEAKVGDMTVRAIDVLTFDEAGKITSLKAYFGPEDIIKG
ncbi:MAG TPA: nuclear transport factor 2 family protein [Alphaproteobacteria bacterium]|nr:nuclear transport factor 2 family protein [Alphaproteobacteria bacterium]